MVAVDEGDMHGVRRAALEITEDGGIRVSDGVAANRAGFRERLAQTPVPIPGVVSDQELQQR